MDAEQKQYERQPQCVLQGELRTVNERARALDYKLAEMIPKVDGTWSALDIRFLFYQRCTPGVVALSADARHSGANAAVLKAAGAHKKPVAGTGGTSLSLAAAMYGCELAGNAGGSVATTSRTKAIGVAASLAGVWNESYAPASSNASATPWRSVVNECLPALVCIACARSSADLLALPVMSELLSSGNLVAPAVGALAATRRSDLGSIATLAGTLLGSFCRGSSCCALLAGGFVFPFVAPQVLAACARHGVPATSSNIAVGGAVPVFLGAACYSIFAPLLTELTDLARWFVRTSLSWWVASATVGIAINYGSRKDWYHAYFLPLIALEYERGDMSAIGALDCLCLCVVGAGACAAQLVVPFFAPSFYHPTKLQYQPSTATYQPPTATQTVATPRQAAGAEPRLNFGTPYAHADAGSHVPTTLAGGRSIEGRTYSARALPTSAPASDNQGLPNSSLDADARLASRGLVINLLCGDYVEACHPFLERDSTLDWAVYVTSFLVGGLAAGAQSSAYLPLPISVFFSNDAVTLSIASLTAFGLPFLIGAASSLYSHRRKHKIR